ncbi:YqgE/AlgH family protein [Pinisolibacter sp.]|uniref:YqgE/AlgH family protein n=1 Tax=Pinisolibacter sp. TaxID=2172024 RepID=UPI002FDEF709
MSNEETAREPDSLAGKILIAMPGMEDKRFARSLVYLCAHSSDGAMGIILNQPAPSASSFAELLVQLDIVGEDESGTLSPLARSMTVQNGGPVETTRGFVLHSSDYFIENATLPIDDHFSLTTTLEVLKAIAEGRGPKDAIMTLGYAGWGAGQLESEIQWNGWLHCPADPILVFDRDLDAKYDRALKKLGIDIGLLSRDAGHG